MKFLVGASGYFFAANFHDFLLLSPIPTEKDLFFQPLSRLLFAQFCAFAITSLQSVRYPQLVIRIRSICLTLLYLALAFILLSIISSVAVIFNAYWNISLILLAILLLCFVYHTMPYTMNRHENI